MLGQFVWLGLFIAVVGAFVPAFFFWNDLKRVRLVLVPNATSDSFLRLSRDLKIYLTLLCLLLVSIASIFLHRQTVHSSLNAGAIIQRAITRMEGNMILLEYEPQPKSVRLIVNGVIYHAQTTPGLLLQGQKLVLEDVEGNVPLLAIVREDAPMGGVILEYQRAP